MRRPTLTIALVVCLLFVVILACSRAPVTDEGLPVTQVGGGVGGGAALQGGVTPNAGSLDVAPFPTVPVRGTPTPDPPRANALYPGGDYQVQPGDSLEAIAQRAGVTVADLVSANEGLDPAAGLSPAMVLHLPAPVVVGPDFKIIPNSELVYSPTTIGFDTINFVQSHGGYLAAYTEEVESRERTGAEIVEFVARQYSVNPRLLLALLEHQSGWVTQQNPDPATLYYPMGHASEPWKSGLDAQLRWAANQLNRGYYLWRAGSLATLTLADGSEVTLVPTLNAGTVGVEHFFAQHYGGAGWRAPAMGKGPWARVWWCVERIPPTTTRMAPTNDNRLGTSLHTIQPISAENTTTE